MAGLGISTPPLRERRLLPVAIVLVVISSVLFGGYVVAAALSEPTGTPVDIAGELRISPLSGWELSSRFGDPPGARLTRGSGNLDAAVVAFDGSSDELLRSYVTDVLERDATQLSISSIEPVTLASGLRGSRIQYVGTFGDVRSSIEGQVSAVVSPSGTGIVFDGWAPSGLLRYVLDDVDTMIGRAEVS